jgi:hypothetical protein
MAESLTAAGEIIALDLAGVGDSGYSLCDESRFS